VFQKKERFISIVGGGVLSMERMPYSRGGQVGSAGGYGGKEKISFRKGKRYLLLIEGASSPGGRIKEGGC